jgi:ribosomal protein L24E
MRIFIIYTLHKYIIRKTRPRRMRWTENREHVGRWEIYTIIHAGRVNGR